MCIYNIFFIDSSDSRHLGKFHILVIKNHAAREKIIKNKKKNHAASRAGSLVRWHKHLPGGCEAISLIPGAKKIMLQKTCHNALAGCWLYFFGYMLYILNKRGTTRSYVVLGFVLWGTSILISIGALLIYIPTAV